MADPSRHRQEPGAGQALEGPLETRGPGVVGKWELRWYRLGDGVLSAFAPEDAHRQQPLASVSLRDVTNLTLEGDRCRWQFEANGQTVRLRAKTEEEAQSWFNSLQAGQAWSQHNGGRAAPGGRASFEDVPLEAGGHTDVLVQIEKLFGLPHPACRADCGCYLVRGRWEGHQSCSRTDERVGKPAADGNSEDCVVKQQLKLQALAGVDHVIISVFRRSVDSLEDVKLVGICRLCALEPEHCAVRLHELTDERGQPTGASVRLRLRPKPQAGTPHQDESSVVQADDASSSKSTVLCHDGGAQAARFDLKAPEKREAAEPPASPGKARSQTPSRGAAERREAQPRTPTPTRRREAGEEAQRPASPGKARSNGQASQRSARSHSPTAASRQPRPKGPRQGPAESSPSHASTRSGVDPDLPTFGRGDDFGDASVSAAASRSQDGTPRAQDGCKPQRMLSPPVAPEHCQMLYLQHEDKQKKLMMKRQEMEREEKKRLQEERQALFKKTQKGMDASKLNPQEAADRLFRDHEKRVQNLRYRQEEFERQARPRSQSVSALSAGQLREVSERLHREHERREQDRQLKRNEREAQQLGEIEKAFVGANTSYNARRHEELYEHAKYRREMLEQKKKHAEEVELKKYTTEASGKQNGTVDYHRLNALYQDHKERRQRHAEALASRQMREEEAIKEAAAASRHKTPPRKAAAKRGSLRSEFDSSGGGNTILTMTLQRVNHKSLSVDAAVKAAFKMAISEVVALEAGEAVTPEAVELSPGPSPTSVVAMVLLPNAGRLRPASGAALAEGVAAHMAAEASLARVATGAVAVSDISLTEEKASLVPSCYRSARVPSEPQEPQAPQRAPLELTTQADVLLAAVVSAIQMRIGYSRTLSPAEMKELSAPLKAAFNVYKETLSIAEKGDGFAQLTFRESQRLFLEGSLLPDSEGCRACSEPDPIRQVEESLDDLLATARAAQETLEKLIAPGGVAWPRGAVRPSPGGVPTALFAYNPGVKTEHAAKVKGFVRYQPSSGRKRYHHLLDLARLTLVFANCEMLQAGMDHICDNFEVLDIRNHFASPHRLGTRFMEVQLVLNTAAAGGSAPHVCELRLEEFSFYRARDAAAPHLETFYEKLRSLYDRAATNMDAVLYLARSVLESPQEAHVLRQFRRHLARRFGSTVGGWRRSFGSSRLVTFERFRDVCQALKIREHAAELWMELDAGRGGSVSLFELDPDAVASLVKLRTRILMLVPSDDIDQDSLFARLTNRVQLAQPGQMEVHEFRAVAKSFGLPSTEADRLFTFLDYQGGSAHNPPARISAADLEWLRRLPSLVDTEAVVMSSESRPSDLESARTCLQGTSTRRARSGGAHGAIMENPAFGISVRRSMRRSSSAPRRSRSQEPFSARSQARTSRTEPVRSPPMPEPSPASSPTPAVPATSFQDELENTGLDADVDLAPGQSQLPEEDDEDETF